jgi:hypothetical protein
VESLVEVDWGFGSKWAYFSSFNCFRQSRKPLGSETRHEQGLKCTIYHYSKVFDDCTIRDE